MMGRRLVRDEQGIALVMAIVLMGILSLTTAALITGVTNNHRTSLKQTDARQAFALAELSLSYAEGMIYNASANHTTPPIGVQTLPAQATGGTGTYYATVGSDGVTWTMTGTGTVDGVSRTVVSTANYPGTSTVTDTGVWNYLYADSTAAGCPTTISGGVVVGVPLLTHGNLCLSGGGKFTGSQLEVNGTLTISGSTSSVGSSTTPVPTVDIAGPGASCTVSSQTVAPGTSPCDGEHSGLWASAVNPTLTVTPSMPSVDFQAEYAKQAALTQTGCPAGLFDNDSTLNNSLSAATLASRLFPSNSSYDCKVGANELKWNSLGSSCSNSTLTVSGEFIFDGSLSLGCGYRIIYSGQATMWFTGTVAVGGGDWFCGIANCTTAWDPDVNGIIWIAGCWADSTGSSLVNSGCVSVAGNSTIQVGIYVPTNYTIAGGSTNMGPVLANTLSIGGSSSTLIPFHIMPPGTPLNSRTAYLPASAPSAWGG